MLLRIGVILGWSGLIYLAVGWAYEFRDLARERRRDRDIIRWNTELIARFIDEREEG